MGYPMTDAQRREAIRQLREGLAPLHAMMTSLRRDSLDGGACERLMAEMDQRQREKERRWERSRPMRERAERAWAAAMARRQAQLGTRQHARIPVMNALWADDPRNQRTRIW